jgi:predicted permease
MLTENEKQKLGKEIALIIVLIGGILTLSYAIYFIVDTINKWYS